MAWRLGVRRIVRLGGRVVGLRVTRRVRRGVLLLLVTMSMMHEVPLLLLMPRSMMHKVPLLLRAAGARAAVAEELLLACVALTGGCPIWRMRRLTIWRTPDSLEVGEHGIQTLQRLVYLRAYICARLLPQQERPMGGVRM